MTATAFHPRPARISNRHVKRAALFLALVVLGVLIVNLWLVVR